jgi:hypothetical protein
MAWETMPISIFSYLFHVLIIKVKLKEGKSLFLLKYDIEYHKYGQKESVKHPVDISH